MPFTMLEVYEIDDLEILFYSGRNKYNQLTYKSVKTKGYIDWKTRLVRDIAGEETVSSATIYINHPRKITHKDYIKIDDVRHSVINMVEAKDFSVNHQEVFIA